MVLRNGVWIPLVCTNCCNAVTWMHSRRWCSVSFPEVGSVPTICFMQSAVFMSVWTIIWWYLHQMAIVVINQSRGKGGYMLLLALQRLTLPTTLSKCYLRNCQIHGMDTNWICDIIASTLSTFSTVNSQVTPQADACSTDCQFTR